MTKIEAPPCCIVAENPRYCVVCGKPTYYVEYCVEMPLCSEECIHEFYDKLYERGQK